MLELTEFAAGELGKNPFIEDGNISIEAGRKRIKAKIRILSALSI
jgi:hypothetical protein